MKTSVRALRGQRWGDTLLDAALLLSVLFPILHFLVFRPLTTDIRRRE